MKKSKHSFLLLEVLFCLLLVIVAFFPLLSPHFTIRKARMEEMYELLLAREADLAFLKLKEEIYEGKKFSWKDFDKGKRIKEEETVSIKIQQKELKFLKKCLMTQKERSNRKLESTSYRLIDVSFTFKPLDTAFKNEASFPYALFLEGRRE